VKADGYTDSSLLLRRRFRHAFGIHALGSEGVASPAVYYRTIIIRRNWQHGTCIGHV
jgi:hypothetical protein